MKKSKEIVNYLDELTYQYAQWCKRPKDGSYYAIADGKQCRQGVPVNYSPEEKAKASNKPGSKGEKKKPTSQGKKQTGTGRGSTTNKSKEASPRQRVSDIVSAAKSRGLSNDEISKIKNEVKTELNAKRVQGKEALKLFAKKADSLIKRKDLLSRFQSSPKRQIKTSDPEEIETLEEMRKQGLVVQLWGLRSDSPALYALKSDLNKYSEDIE